MPKKFKRCVEKVKGRNRLLLRGRRFNPYAICRVSTRYYGSTRHKKRKGR